MNPKESYGLDLQCSQNKCKETIRLDGYPSGRACVNELEYRRGWLFDRGNALCPKHTVKKEQRR